MEERVFAPSKNKLSLMLLGSLMFVVAGCWMLLNPFPFYITLLAFICIFFFSFCGIFAARKWFDSSPGLVVNAAGITDNSRALSVGLIPWSDITEIAEYEIQNQKMISIKVQNPADYASRAGKLMRMINTANIKMSGTPINISANSLKIQHAELSSLIHDYFRQSRNQVS